MKQKSDAKKDASQPASSRNRTNQKNQNHKSQVGPVVMTNFISSNDNIDLMVGGKKSKRVPSQNHIEPVKSMNIHNLQSFGQHPDQNFHSKRTIMRDSGVGTSAQGSRIDPADKEELLSSQNIDFIEKYKGIMITDLSLDETAMLPNIKIGNISIQPGVQKNQQVMKKQPSTFKQGVYQTPMKDIYELPKEKKSKISRNKSVKRNENYFKTGNTNSKSLFGNPEAERKKFQNSATVSALLLGASPVNDNSRSVNSIGQVVSFNNQNKPSNINKSPSLSIDNSNSIFQLPAINEAESRIQKSIISESSPQVNVRGSYQFNRNVHNSSEPLKKELETQNFMIGGRKPSDKYLQFLLKHQIREESMMQLQGGSQIIDENPEGERGESNNILFRSTIKTPIREKLRQSMQENEKFMRDSQKSFQQIPLNKNLSSSQEKIIEGYKEYLMKHELPSSITQGQQYEHFKEKNAEELKKFLKEPKIYAVRERVDSFEVVKGSHKKISQSINFQSMKEINHIHKEYKKDGDRSNLASKEKLNRSSHTTSQSQQRELTAKQHMIQKLNIAPSDRSLSALYIMEQGQFSEIKKQVQKINTKAFSRHDQSNLIYESSSSMRPAFKESDLEIPSRKYAASQMTVKELKQDENEDMKFSENLYSDKDILQEIRKIVQKKKVFMDNKINQSSPNGSKRGQSSPFSVKVSPQRSPKFGSDFTSGNTSSKKLNDSNKNSRRNSVVEEKNTSYEDYEEDLTRILKDEYRDIRLNKIHHISNKLSKNIIPGSDKSILIQSPSKFKVSPSSGSNNKDISWAVTDMDVAIKKTDIHQKIQTQIIDSFVGKVPQGGLKVDELRLKQGKFFSNLQLVEENLVKVIAKESQEIAKWKKQEYLKQVKLQYQKRGTIGSKKSPMSSALKAMSMNVKVEKQSQSALSFLGNSPQMSRHPNSKRGSVRYSDAGTGSKSVVSKNYEQNYNVGFQNLEKVENGSCTPLETDVSQIQIENDIIQLKAMRRGIKTEFPDNAQFLDNINILENQRQSMVSNFKNTLSKSFAREKDNLKYDIQENGEQELLDISSFLNAQLKGKDLVKTQDKQSKMSQYIKYLTNENNLLYALRQKFKHYVKLDLISNSNSKALALTDQLVDEVQGKILFKDMCKNTNYASTIPLRNMPANLKYFMQSEKEQSLVLPVFQKIFEQKLILVDYHLDIGLVKSLVQGFEAHPGILNKLVVDNCGINEESSTFLFEAATKLDHLDTMVLKNQEFSYQAARYLNNILPKSFPNQLQTLKLVKCKMSQETLEQLIDNLIQHSFVRNLVLMKVNFTPQSIEKLSFFIEHNRFLKMLDISWNNLTSQQYVPILESLSQNETLQEINLSHNHLVPLPTSNFDERLDEMGQQVAVLIQQILENNQCLQHLFLNQCSLSFAMIESIMPYIRYSPSLIAVHLSNNPGIQPEYSETFNKLKDLMGIQDKSQIKNDKSLLQPTSKDTNLNFNFTDLLKGQHTEENCSKKVLSDSNENSPTHSNQGKDILSQAHKEQILARRIIREKNVENSYIATQDPYVNSIFIAQRILGFDEELFSQRLHHNWEKLKKGTQFYKLPSTWEIILTNQRKCWVCDKHQYSLIFWNKQIGEDQSLKIKNPERVVQHLKKPQMVNNQQRPILYTFKNQWRGQELHTISEFCFIIDRRKESSLYNVSIDFVKDFEFDQVAAIKSEKYDTSTLYQLEHQMKSYKSDFREVIDKNLEFREAQFINSSEKNLQMMQPKKTNSKMYPPFHENSFVLPQFLYAGNFSYVIEYEGKFYFHKCLVQYRKENIPHKTLNVGFYDDDQDLEVKTFSHPASVFSLYVTHTDDKIMEQCFEHDKRCLEFSSFLNHDDEYQAYTFMEKNFHDLKYFYTFALGQSLTPRGIDLEHLKKFLQGICCTSKLTNEIIEQTFEKVLTIEAVKGHRIIKDENKPDDLLCRKEFIELFIRLAVIEHPPNLSKKENVKASYEKFLEYNFKNKIPLSYGHKFRKDEVWTKEVNTIIQNNRALIQSVITLKRYTQPLSFLDIEYIFMIDSNPQIVKDKQILVEACAFAKMTVFRDYEIDNAKMDQYSAAEFYEIMARVVDIQSRGTSEETLLMHHKLEKIMDQIVKIANPNAEAMSVKRKQTIQYVKEDKEDQE